MRRLTAKIVSNNETFKLQMQTFFALRHRIVGFKILFVMMLSSFGRAKCQINIPQTTLVFCFFLVARRSEIFNNHLPSKHNQNILSFQRHYIASSVIFRIKVSKLPFISPWFHQLNDSASSSKIRHQFTVASFSGR